MTRYSTSNVDKLGSPRLTGAETQHSAKPTLSLHEHSILRYLSVEVRKGASAIARLVENVEGLNAIALRKLGSGIRSRSGRIIEKDQRLD